MAQKYKGARLLILRLTRESLTQSALVTFERDILGEGHPLTLGARRDNRGSYHYSTGSEVVVAGLKQSGRDQRAKVMSTDYDIIYVQEATEILESDYEKLTTRLGHGGHSMVPHPQIILDFNPYIPLHWIYRRERTGKLKLFKSIHQDNPNLWDGEKWTSQGEIYLNTLQALTGVERLRLYEGVRAMAQGLVYGEVWDDGSIDGNVTEAADYHEGDGDIVWGVDDGYAGLLGDDGYFTPESHPRVFLLAQVRPDGTICVFAEDYRIKRLSNEHLGKVVEMPYPRPQWAAVDKSAAELRGLFHSSAFGIYTQTSPSSVKESIKTLRNFLAKDKNGKRRVLIHPRCKFLRMEMSVYHYEPGAEDPVKESDHGCDALRYLVWQFRNS